MLSCLNLVARPFGHSKLKFKHNSSVKPLKVKPQSFKFHLITAKKPVSKRFLAPVCDSFSPSFRLLTARNLAYSGLSHSYLRRYSIDCLKMEPQLVQGVLGPDPHSFANFDEIAPSHMNIDLEIDFTQKIFLGFVEFTMKAKKDGVSHALLDTRNLKIHDAVSCTEGVQVSWCLPKKHAVISTALEIKFSTPLTNGQEVKFKVTYETTSESGGIQWFEPHQTLGKKHPFVFTQFQAIQARSAMPCMDSPSCKTPFNARLTVPEPLVALASGQLVREADGSIKSIKSNGKLTYFFEQPFPVPCYLLAFVAGSLQGAKVGPRSEIFAEAEILKSAVDEFGEHVEKYVKTTEELTGIDYLWNTYNMVVLPASYAYGGMENVCLTFINAGLIVGDRSLIDVVAHEIAHSWSGNDATNATWLDFWLNEGFTMYLERLILGATNNEEYRKFQILLGYKDLIKTIDFLADDPPSWTSLQPDTIDTDPDDAFSIIPYEKGCLFVYFLENVVGGPEKMTKWLNVLYKKYEFGIYTSADLKASFIDFFSKNGLTEADFKKIDWDHWLNGTGLPNFDPTELLKTPLSDACTELANKWLAAAEDPSKISPSADDISSFKPAQIMYFLDEITTSGKRLSHATVEKLEATYKLFDSKNPEIAFRVLIMGLEAKVDAVVPHVKAFLAQQGRGRYAKPVYTALVEYDLSLAQQVYQENRLVYQAVVRTGLDKIVKK